MTLTSYQVQPMVVTSAPQLHPKPEVHHQSHDFLARRCETSCNSRCYQLL